MPDYSIPTNDTKNVFYMREVERFFNRNGWYPDYFLCNLIKCDICSHYFSEPNMYFVHDQYKKRWFEKDSCLFCAGERYFKYLAEGKLRNSGLKPKDHPDLYELEVIASKIKYELNKDNQHNTKYKIKIPQL